MLRFLNTSQIRKRLEEADEVPLGQCGGSLQENVATVSLCEKDYPPEWTTPQMGAGRLYSGKFHTPLLPLSPAVLCSGSFLLSTLISVSNQLATLCAT